MSCRPYLVLSRFHTNATGVSHCAECHELRGCTRMSIKQNRDLHGNARECDFEYCYHCYQERQNCLWICEGVGDYVDSRFQGIGLEEKKVDMAHVTRGTMHNFHVRKLYPECAVYFEHRPFVTMVHGSSGHTICCRTCAKILVD